VCLWGGGGGWAGWRKALGSNLLTDPKLGLRDSEGQGWGPTLTFLGSFFRVHLEAIPRNMAKFALNQNLPGECVKWVICVCTDPQLVPVLQPRGLFFNTVRDLFNGPLINVMALCKTSHGTLLQVG
jgi:hypothetical protein